MKARLPQTVLGLTIVGCAVAVIMLGDFMAPIKKGTSAKFWLAACGVKLNKAQDGIPAGLSRPRDDYYLYDELGFGGSYKVPWAEADADFPRVVQELKRQAVKTNLPPISQRALSALAEQSEFNGYRPERFVESLIALRMKGLALTPVQRHYWDLGEKSMDEGGARAGRLWLNQAFEIVFLSGLAFFLFWPWLRRGKLWQWLLHWGASPLILCIPYTAVMQDSLSPIRGQAEACFTLG